MSQEFLTEIISPEKVFYKSKTLEATIPSFEGAVGILYDHIPIITFLRPGIIILRTSKGEESFFVEDGVVEFKNNNLNILSNSAVNVIDLKKNIIDELIKNSNKILSQENLSDKEIFIHSHKIDILKQIS